FEIVFRPPDIGEYVSTMNLYLDEDPLVARSIEVRGRALFVEAHGGGGVGCSAGHGTGGGMALVMLALLRRKRKRA
ncbi:MAG TPA: MYXO-CTERM sorting domain-containing protein, partial [Kofleriaceae bacterium]|nr:MYXO-CTERM sorting domain-containing protein [Kofleriaceae bacterium]